MTGSKDFGKQVSRLADDPRWEKPVPLGYASSADAAHFVAAPLLAAGALALLGVIAADNDKFAPGDVVPVVAALSSRLTLMTICP